MTITMAAGLEVGPITKFQSLGCVQPAPTKSEVPVVKGVFCGEFPGACSFVCAKAALKGMVKRKAHINFFAIT
jgi:hypothetical protein